MAKKKEETNETEDVSVESAALAKALIKDLNKDSKEKIAWCLATDHDDPTTVRDFISTGSTLLDYIASNRRGGGVPVGKLTEICGEEATGKSLVATHILANTQKKGGLAILIDTENALNPDFAHRVGLDMKKLVYIQAQTVEEVFENIEKTISLTRARDVKIPVTIIWDSVAGTPTKAEIEGTYDPNDRIGVTAKAIAKGMRKITQMLGKDKVTLVFTNQLKVKIGVMFSDPMTTPGGKAIPYHSSLRIRLNRSSEIKDEESKETYAIKTYGKIIKCRLGPPLRRCEFEIHFSNGIDDANSIRDYLWSVGEIEKRAGYMVMNYEGEELKFRASAWTDFYEKKPGFKDHVFNLLDKHLIVKYDATDVKDFDGSEDSLMDVEGVLDSVSEETAPV